jgi:AraC-like DNA-binding protein
MRERIGMPRSVVSVAILVEFATENGMRVADCLNGSGITDTELADPAARIRPEQELRVVSNLLERLGDRPALGLRVGRRYHLTTHGIWAFAVISSPTVRHAWRTALRYMELTYSFARWRFEEYDDTATVLIDHDGIAPRLRTFLLERTLAAIITLDREVFGTPLLPARVELDCAAPDYVDDYAELLGSAPIFDAPETRIVMPGEILDRPMPQANAYAAALAESQVAGMLRHGRRRTGIAARVRAAVVARGGAATQRQIATELGTSARTLSRRLAAEGTGYREILAEARRMLAEELLIMGLSVEEIAARLGYAEASSFTHAFIRWTGMPPGRFARTRDG